MSEHVPEDVTSPEDQAIVWLVRLTSGETTQEELRRYEAWRRMPGHDEAMAQARKLWLQLGNSLETLDYVQPVVAPRRWWPEKMRKPALAAATVFLAIGLGHQWWGAWRHSYATDLGQQSTAVLMDGSTVILNTDSALDVIGNGGRHVSVARGEVYFDVMRDPLHTFVIDAGIGKIEVLGTAFSVRRDSQGTVVTVQRGRVRVTAEGGDSVELTPDWQVKVYNNSPTLRQVRVDAGQQLGWREGRLFFVDKPLSELAAELERYDRRVVFVSKDVSDLRLSATVNIERLDDWYQSLDKTAQVNVSYLGPFVWLSKKND